MNLKGMSANALKELAIRANKLALDLEKEQPSLELALENGIKDESYDTVRCGRVKRYSGNTVIEMSNGQKWKAIGHRPIGGADYITKDGFVEFIKIEE